MLCLQFNLVALLMNKAANIGHCQQSLLRWFFCSPSKWIDFAQYSCTLAMICDVNLHNSPDFPF